MNDEEILRAIPAATLSAEQDAALERILARLVAAEKVCEMIKASLSPKARMAAEKKTYWWDVGIAVKQWEELRGR